MQHYLTRFSYTPATWSRLIQNPEDRRGAATQYIEAVGGRLHGFWHSFGDHDAYGLTCSRPPTRSHRSWACLSPWESTA